ALSASPFGGKEFLGWTINGIPVGEDLDYLIKITSNLNITANFRDLVFEINAITNPPNAGVVEGIGYYYFDEEAILKASGNYNWIFEYWSENENFISNDSLLTLTVDGNRNLTANFSKLTGLSEDNEIVNDYFIHNPYPNPFNPSTTFRFGIKNRSIVSLEIVDIKGKIVNKLLSSDIIDKGIFEKVFTAKNLSSGVYLYIFRALDLLSA
ncbi:MAG: T9SS type A sorting domain-containing protein, partial [Ignavibacteriaceae bacterium]